MKQEFHFKTADLYCQTAQSGFITEKNRRQWEQLEIPELNSGFSPVYWYAGKELTEVCADSHGCYVLNNEDGRLPETFAVHVSLEGNYKVDITLYSEDNVDEVVLFLGRRRLAFLGSFKKGQIWRGSFITNVCPIIPRNHEESMEDDTVDITVLGARVHLQYVGVLQVQCPTLYIAGDSTVTDQSADYPYYPYHSYAGWGQMLSFFMGNSAAVSNHSHSGLTTESFRSEGHYKIMYDRMKAGDVCLLQFGHNDQKLMHLKADGGYRDNLIRYINEMKDKGVIPVIVTPLARNTWKGNDNTYNDLLEEYANECIRIAKEYQVPLVDLHKRSKELVIQLGSEEVKKYYFPSDYTHSNDYGAFLFAGYVFEEMLKEQTLKKVCSFNRTECQIDEVRQTVWAMPEKFEIIEPPKDLAAIANPNEERLFENLDRPEDPLCRVEALELIITAMHFFPTNVYNDAFDDIVGHETYAGTVECAYQNGLIPDDFVKDHNFYPKKLIRGKEFVRIAENGYRSRKGVAIPSEIISKIDNDDYITRRTAANVCKQLHI